MVEEINQTGRIRVDFTDISDEIITSERIDHFQVKLIPPFWPPKGSRIPFKRPKAYTTKKMPFKIPIDLPYGYNFKVQARAHNTKGYGPWSHRSVITIGQEICTPAEDPDPVDPDPVDPVDPDPVDPVPRRSAVFYLEVGGEEYPQVGGHPLEIVGDRTTTIKIKNIGGGKLNWAIRPPRLLNIVPHEGILSADREDSIEIKIKDDFTYADYEDHEGEEIVIISKAGKTHAGYFALLLKKNVKVRLYCNLRWQDWGENHE